VKPRSRCQKIDPLSGVCASPEKPKGPLGSAGIFEDQGNQSIHPGTLTTTTLHVHVHVHDHGMAYTVVCPNSPPTRLPFGANSMGQTHGTVNGGEGIKAARGRQTMAGILSVQMFSILRSLPILFP
jgi:hypothetical protein